MKKLLFLLMFSPSISMAQHTTTEVEFNYLTKGYKVDMAEGRDIKSGYRLDKIGNDIPIGTYTFNLNAFVKLDEKAVAAVLVIVKSKEWNNTYYLCIPFNNAELYQKYYAEISAWDAPISRAYAFICSTAMGAAIAEDMNKDLQK